MFINKRCLFFFRICVRLRWYLVREEGKVRKFVIVCFFIFYERFLDLESVMGKVESWMGKKIW